MLKRITFLLVSALLMASAAHADLVIDVQGVSQPTPVAIVPFGWESDSPNDLLDVATIIKNDLRRSGRFAPTSEDNMLQKPTQKTLMTASLSHPTTEEGPFR